MMLESQVWRLMGIVTSKDGGRVESPHEPTEEKHSAKKNLELALVIGTQYAQLWQAVRLAGGLLPVPLVLVGSSLSFTG